MNATKTDNKLLFEVNLQRPKLSKSGQNLVVATTRGPWESGVEIDGKPIVIVINAYIAADAPAKDKQDEEAEELDPKPKSTRARK
jgi:hypothetical protein